MAGPSIQAREETTQPLRIVAETSVVDRRDRRLRVIAGATVGGLLLGIFYTLYFAQTILVPFVLAILLNLVLSPLVRRLARIGVPEGIGAAIVLLMTLVIIGTGVFQLSGPASEWFDRAPYTFAKLERKLQDVKGSMKDVQEATKKVEQLADGGEEEAERVVVQGPSMAETFVSSTYSVLAAILIMTVLLYFLLASGDLFLRKLVQVLPKLKDKKRAIEIARRCERDISTYLLTVTCVNTCLGIVVGAAMWLIGMPNPVLWGALAGIANFIPYLGPTLMIAILTLAGVASFDSWTQMLAPPALFLLITSLEGNFVTPSILGSRLALNPVAIFAAILVWGFLWGIPGILIAVPLLAAIKILCDNIEPLWTIGQFLGRRDQDPNPPKTEVVA